MNTENPVSYDIRPHSTSTLRSRNSLQKRETPSRTTSGDSSEESDSQDDYAPNKQTLEECAATCYEQAQEVNDQLERLKKPYNSILALSSRLVVIHPNSLETPTLALDLRNLLVDTATSLKKLDADLFNLWESEERVRKACGEKRFSIDGMTGTALSIEVQRRQDEVEGLLKKFRRRCKDIKSEARWEREERREIREERKEPVGVNDYLARGLDCTDLTKKDVVHASRWVVTNPFTVLSKLLDNMKTLQIPQMINASQTPSTFLARDSTVSARRPGISVSRFESTPLMIDNPTPAGTVNRTRGLSDWKAQILREAPSKPTPLHKAFDKFASRMGGDYSYKNEQRSKAEKWIIILWLALFPLFLIAILVQKLFGSSFAADSSSNLETSSSDRLLTTLFPTMMNGAKTLSGDMSVETGSVSGGVSSMRRRDSFQIDSQHRLDVVVVVIGPRKGSGVCSKRRSVRRFDPSSRFSSSTSSLSRSYNVTTRPWTMNTRMSDPFAAIGHNTVPPGGYDTDILSGGGGRTSSAPGTATRTSTTPARNVAGPPTLTAGSFRTGASGPKKTPWYLKTVWIVVIVLLLLLALGLGVGLGVGLGTKNNNRNSSVEQAEAGSESTITSYSTYSSIVTGEGATTVVPVIGSGTRSRSASIVIETISGSTVVTLLQPETQGAGSGVFVTVSETRPPTTRTNVVYVTTFPSTQTITTTLEGGVAQTVFETITVRRTVTSQATARP
ncbi:uncharacterized protein JCM6883_007039 [Sporobolomyces salmoneus]|uniref:uncharacterized protein n=1 Tax=Sporobolomyces salmoneus TaxID=183962 RepID=UPI00316B30A6